MTRQELNEKDLWDLSDLFVSDEAWEQAFKAIPDLAKAFNSKKGSVLKSADDLYETLKLMENLNRKATNVVTYARLKLDEDTKNSTYQTLASRAESLVTEVSEYIAYFAPEVMLSDLETVKQLLNEKEELSLYHQYFEDLFRGKPYILSEEIENILSQTVEMGNTAANAYGMLLNADLTFEEAIDQEGKPHPLTNGSYIPMMMGEDRVLRQDAFNKFYKSYEAHINTIATLMQAEVKKNIFYAKVRGYKNAREAALFENNIPASVPDALIEAVNKHLPVFHKYMKLRKDVLGYDELHLYDIYNPIVQNVDYKVPYEEAKETVLKAIKPLGDAYHQVVESAFEQRWIDVYETKGKRGGAYSWGTYDSRPYILLNHKDNVDSMFTLAHEMGHSMHSYLTHKTQPYVYGHYSIFVAEVASTTNEALLNHYLMQTLTDDEKKKYILNHYLEQFRGTIFRQTMFAEFERDIHAHVESGGALTADYLCDHYLALNRKYFGDDVVIDEAIKYEWARIPHMYYNFYVYQYATGFSAAIAFANKMIQEGQVAIDAYLGFLSSGCKDYPINILRQAGVDMETPEPVNNALEIFEKSLEEFESLMR